MTKSQQVTKLHNQSMEFAELGYFAQRKKDTSKANDYFKQAFELERQAAMLMINDYDIEPTRSILFKGAAQLAFNFSAFREMERMIGFALSGNPDEETASELRQLFVDAELEMSENSISKSIIKYKTLSNDLQKEVDDFVDFLIQKYAKTA